MKELLGYVFSPLREGDIALYRGSGNGLAPILLAAAEETSLGCVEQLKHEFALKAELHALREEVGALKAKKTPRAKP